MLRPVPGPAARRPRALAAAAGLAVLLAGCVTPPVVQTTEEDAAPSPGASAAPDEVGGTIEELYAQEVAWSGCGAYECATVRAPLDWDDPAAGQIDLAVQRSVARDADARIGSLLLNPGGPGGSGLEFFEYAVNDVLGDAVLDAYDAVAFDPRGVGASTAVDCGPDSVVDAFLTADVPLDDQADLDAARERVRAFGEGCLEATGPLLGEVDTVSAARDMDLLRAVLGDEQLHYLGFSYGTFLGATYAELYPENVGRLVLDGAVDPGMSYDDLVVGQAIGFENAMRAYVEDCQAADRCPLSGDVDDGMRQIGTLLEKIGAQPLPTSGGGELNAVMAFNGIAVTLYDDASWSYLTAALTEALQQGTGDTLLDLANFYLDRDPDGRYLSNSMIAFTAINCLDYPTPERSYDELRALADEVAEDAPTTGDMFIMAAGCEAWPFPAASERAPTTAAGAAPVLVVGTTGDPATPYAWSESLADQLESGTLLTWEGEGHTAYGRSNACVEDAVDAYLVEGTVPAEGTTC